MAPGYFARKLRFFKNFKQTRQDGGDAQLQAALGELKGLLGGGNDVKVHSFRFGRGGKFRGALVFIDGLADSRAVTEAILRPLVRWNGDKVSSADGGLLDTLARTALCAGDVEAAASLGELAAACLSGDTALLADGCAAGLIVSTKGWDKRGVTEPLSETVVRGPREGFTESLRTNTALIRRKIKNGNLRVERMSAGRKTQTDICLIYLDGVANPEVVETVKYRIGKLDTDAILESGYIEEYIEDAPFSPFATIGYSEKPDVIAARILEGRTAIVVDGTPFVLTAPMLFIESFQTAEDYYARPLYAALTRLLRFAAYAVTVFAPAVYIALTSFHQELIPTTLLLTIANAHEGTPFPVFIETAIMVFAFEVLREAGIRLPRPIGQTISIVGALIMGEAAVSAGIVSAPMVIVIAVMAVASFLVPFQNESASVLRILMMTAAAFLGWYGISMGCLAVLVHLATLNSFGVPYFDCFSRTENVQDSVIRMPLWFMVNRPRDLARGDIRRGKFFIPPPRPHEANAEERDRL
ncbi:MAG: spore germination protein [Clostridiales bacterium]|nr:spore germination protein [Clostridiales bacterium]